MSVPKEVIEGEETPVETPVEPVETAEPTLEEGMRKAIEEAPPEEDMPLPNPEPREETPVEPVVDPAEPVVETPEQLAEKAKAELESEMDSLGIKAQRSRERFTHLTKENAELRPYKEALDSIGVSDISQLPILVERAKAADSFEQALQETGAPPEDFGLAMDVLRKLNSGDMALANEAYDALVDQLRALSPILGRSLEGIDPLTPELREMVEDGSLTEEIAIELNAKRKREEIASQSTVQAETANQATQVEQTVRAELTNLGNSYATQDPFYAEKQAVLIPILQTIMANLPPEKWVEATKDAYLRIPNPAPKAPPAPPVQNPIRPRTPHSPMIPEGLSALEAMQLGIRQANGEL